MKKLVTVLTFILLASTSALLAYPGGVSGYTKKSGTAGCGCHGSSYYSSSVYVAIAGPDTVSPNATVTYTVTVTSTLATRGGCDIAASSGTLSPVSSYLKSLSGELTHSTSASYSGGSVSFSFTYKAPATPGAQTIYATGSAKKYWNFAPNKTITVMDPTAVEFTLFTAALTGKEVVLDWKTATEKNNRGFYVEKNAGSFWETAAFVAGAGTTTSITQYKYVYSPTIDELGKSLGFRLKQTDFDGSYMYSEEQFVNIAGSGAKASLKDIYPNPAHGDVTINYSLEGRTPYTLSLFSITGKEIAVIESGVKNAGDGKIILNPDDYKLSAGVYFVVFNAGATKLTRKLVLLK